MPDLIEPITLHLEDDTEAHHLSMAINEYMDSLTDGDYRLRGRLSRIYGRLQQSRRRAASMEAGVRRDAERWGCLHVLAILAALAAACEIGYQLLFC